MIRRTVRVVRSDVRLISFVSFGLAFVVGCGATTPPAPSDGLPIEGSGMRLELDGERIARIIPTAVDTRTWLSPSIIDSHVHLAYWPVADELAQRGLGAVVDLAAPERTLAQRAPIHVIAAGPMLTQIDGYPLDSWGSDGYGIGCADAACVRSTIDRLASRGARVVKIALDDNGLDPALVPVAVEAAHAKNLKVAVHALSDRSAALAARAGADLLAHTPVEPLLPETVAAWRGRAVISTLAAFGGSASAVANLRALHASGATILYGTDLGNLRDAGPSEDEIALLEKAGLGDAAIADAMTTTPARYWGLPFGSISVGAEATLLVLDRDPRTDVRTVLTPRAIWLRGRRIR
jgi:imidazolonepropionase-like amidohydrolase